MKFHLYEVSPEIVTFLSKDTTLLVVERTVILARPLWDNMGRPKVIIIEKGLI